MFNYTLLQSKKVNDKRVGLSMNKTNNIKRQKGELNPFKYIEQFYILLTFMSTTLKFILKS